MTRTFKLKSYRVIQFGGFLKVQIAARNLADDLQKILQAKAVLMVDLRSRKPQRKMQMESTSRH